MAAEGKKEQKPHVSQLEKTTIHLTAEHDEALKRADVLRSENGKLLRRLMMYENPHTPPSLQKRGNKEEQEQKKRGAP